MAGDPLTRSNTHQHLAVIVDADGRGRKITAVDVGDEASLAILPDANQAVGCAEIDTDDHQRDSAKPSGVVQASCHHGEPGSANSSEIARSKVSSRSVSQRLRPRAKRRPYSAQEG